MKALIFGINGQDGYYLSKLLTSNNIEVTGASRSDGNWMKGDVADYNFVSSLIKKITPDYIFHLAANSTTKHEALVENHQTIATGTLNILEAVYKFSPASKVFISGSGLQFINKGKSIKEDDDFEALSAYAVARIQATFAARYYRTLGVKAYVGYFMHHDSPVRKEWHLNIKIVKTAIRIKNGCDEKIEVGNIDVVKEFNFAGDLMEAIWVLVNQEDIFEAMIGCGIGYTIKHWVDVCSNLLGIELKKYIKQDKNFIAPFHSLVADASTITLLGWKPKHTINDLAKMIINAYNEKDFSSIS